MGGAKVRETSTVFVVQRFACADSKKHPPHLHTANEVACQWHRRFPDAKNDNGRNCVCSLTDVVGLVGTSVGNFI
jgi:hypothetical protein